MPWAFTDCENDARYLREIAEIPQDSVLRASEIGRLAGLTFTIRTQCGCKAEIHVDDLRVYLHAHGRAHTRNFNNAHELAHFVRTLLDDGFPHDEERADWTALALLMPRGPVQGLVRRVGLRDPGAVTEAFPEVPPAWAYLRAAWVCGRAAAVHCDGERRVWAPEGFPVPQPGQVWEARLVRRARTTLRWESEIFGAEAFPLGMLGRDGVVVLLPEAASTAGW